MGKAAYAIRITGRNKRSETAIFYSLYKALIGPGIFPGKMSVPYPALGALTPAVIQRWFESGDLLRPVYALLCGTFYNATSYEESKFLALMQALETFHRRTDNADYWGKEEYAAWVI